MATPDPAWAAIFADSSFESQIVLQPVLGDHDANSVVDFRFVHVNSVAAGLLQRDAKDVVGTMLSDLAPGQNSSFRADLSRAHLTGETIQRSADRSGGHFNATRTDCRIVPYNGLLLLVIADRSDERRLQQTDEIVRILEAGIDLSPTATAIIEPIVGERGEVVDVRFLRVNDVAAEMLGVTKPALTGATLYSVLDRRTQGLIGLVQQCWVSGDVVSTEYQSSHSQVRPEWVRFQMMKVGQVIVLHAHDITQQRRTQDELQASESKFRAIVERAAELIVVSDRDGFMRYANPFTVSVVGVQESEIIGRQMVEFTVPEDRAGAADVFTRMRNGTLSTDRRRMRIVDSDGRVRNTVGSSVALRTSDGQFDGIITIAADVTERLASEEARNELAAALAVAEQQERERLARLLHDGPVQHLAALGMQLGAEVTKPVIGRDVVTRAEETVVNAIGDLRTLMFQLSPPDLEGVGLGQAIRNRAEMIFDGTETVVLVDAIDIIEADLSEFAAAISTTLFRLAQEALVNARKHAGARQVTVTLAETEDMYVLDVNDDGIHADPARLVVSQPGHLGLQMIEDRSRQLGGSSKIEAVLGHGTTVRVTIPRLSVEPSD
jgi:PAS domain S-box-containing protein